MSIVCFVAALLFSGTNSPKSAAPALRKIPPYDPVKDFTAIRLISV